MNTPQSAPLSFEIAASDLEAARRFLLADLDLPTTPCAAQRPHQQPL